MALGTHTTYSAEETHLLGKTFGESLDENTIIALQGDLGAGKTTFIRGLVEGIGDIDPRSVSSPTFNFLNIYQGNQVPDHESLCHSGCVKAPGLRPSARGVVLSSIQPPLPMAQPRELSRSPNDKDFRGQALVVYHFDLYRLPRKEEFFAAGFDEYFQAGGVCCLEWAEKLECDLPAGAYLVNISYFGEEGRQIEISKSAI